jgi:hypothetical protein
MLVENEVVGGPIEFFVGELGSLLGIDLHNCVSDGVPVL